MALSKHSTEELEVIIRENRGNVTAAARSINVRRSALKELIDRTPELKDALAEAREELLDQAEANVYDGVYEGDDKYTRFVLSTLGKSRGYTTGTQLSTDPNAPASFDHVIIFEGVKPGEVQTTNNEPEEGAD